MSISQLLASTTTNIDLKTFRVEIWTGENSPTMSIFESSRRFESAVHIMHPDAVLGGAQELMAEGVPGVRVQRDVYRQGQLVRIYLSPSHFGAILEFNTPQDNNNKIMIPCGVEGLGQAQSFLAVARTVLNQGSILAHANVLPAGNVPASTPPQYQLPQQQDPFAQPISHVLPQQPPQFQAGPSRGRSDNRKRGGRQQEFGNPQRFKPDTNLRVTDQEWSIFPTYAGRFVEYAKSGKPFPTSVNSHNVHFWANFFPQAAVFDSDATMAVRQLVRELGDAEKSVVGEEVVEQPKAGETCEGSAATSSTQASTSQEDGHKDSEEAPVPPVESSPKPVTKKGGKKK